MNWKYEVIEKLKGYTAHKNALTSIPKEIELLEASSQSIRSASGGGDAAHSGGNSREDMLISNIVKREELKRQLTQAAAWVEIVEAALETLTDEQRKIVDAMYINRRKDAVTWLCEDLFCEKTTVYRRRDEALAQLTRAIYGYEIC